MSVCVCVTRNSPYVAKNGKKKQKTRITQNMAAIVKKKQKTKSLFYQKHVGGKVFFIGATAGMVGSTWPPPLWEAFNSTLHMLQPGWPAALRD